MWHWKFRKAFSRNTALPSSLYTLREDLVDSELEFTCGQLVETEMYTQMGKPIVVFFLLLVFLTT